MDIKELGLDQPLLTQYPISISKCVSNLNLGNLYNSIIEEKQSDTCFHFLDDLCAIYGVYIMSYMQLNSAISNTRDMWVIIIQLLCFCSAKEKGEG